MSQELSIHSERIWELLAKIQDGEQDFNRLLEAAQEIFEADGASLFLERESAGTFQLTAATGLSASIPSDATVRSSEGLAGLSIAERKPLLVGNPQDLSDGAGAKLRRRDEITSSMVVPLILSNHRPVGVINFARGRKHPTFTEADLERAASVAGNLALIFENARLMADLRQSHAMLSKVLQSFDIGVCVFDADRQLITHNEPAKHWLSSRPDRWDEFLASLPPDLAILAKIGAHAAADSEDSQSDLWQGECDFGDEYLKVNVIKLAGDGIAWTVQNLTEHVQAQRETARLQRLAEIGRMTAVAAHEIRNPLTSIAGAAHLIQECPDRAVDFAQIIEDESLKLGQLCNEFLDFSKPMHLRRADIKIKPLLERLSEQHRFEAESRGVTVSVSAEDAPGTVYADPARIEQAARNLLLNAIQACGKGGKVELAAEPKGFKVIDNGSGVSDEFMARMFTPFSTTKPDGTGLGLCSVKQIVDAHGGVVMVEQLPVGTAFRVRLPETAA